jgi:hypothetical protein
MGIDPTAQKLKANQIHGSKQGCQTGVPDRGRTGPDGVPDGGPTGCATGWPDGVPDGLPDGVARRGGRRGARRGLTGPDGCHVIGHVIFECQVTRLGWQGVILLPILVSQR